MLGGGVPVICRLGAFSKMWLTVDLNPGRALGLGSDTGTIIPRIMPRRPQQHIAMLVFERLQRR